LRLMNPINPESPFSFIIHVNPGLESGKSAKIQSFQNFKEALLV